MILPAFGIGLGVVLGLLTGGRLDRLRSTGLRREIPILVLFMAQALARGRAASLLGPVAVAVWGACSVSLVLALIPDIRRHGVGVAVAGVVSNALVILLNGGMPVVAPPGEVARVATAVAGSQGFYHIANISTHALLLGDVLPAGSGVASAGDLLLAIGVCVFIAGAMIGEADEADLP